MNYNEDKPKIVLPGCMLMTYKNYLENLHVTFREKVCKELGISYATFYRRIQVGISIVANPTKAIKPPFNIAEEKALREIFREIVGDIVVFAEDMNRTNIFH